MLRTGLIGIRRPALRTRHPSLHRIEEVSLEAVAESDEGLLLDEPSWPQPIGCKGGGCPAYRRIQIQNQPT